VDISIINFLLFAPLLVNKLIIKYTDINNNSNNNKL